MDAEKLERLYEAAQGCTCRFHRYTVAYICPCGELIDHSHDSWLAHRWHKGGWLVFPSFLYEHGDTPARVREKVAAWREITKTF